MGFKDYKIRDGVHIPSDKFRKGWDAIFGKKGSVLNSEESFKSKEYATTERLDEVSKSTKGVKDDPKKRETTDRDTQKTNT